MISGCSIENWGRFGRLWLHASQDTVNLLRTITSMWKGTGLLWKFYPLFRQSVNDSSLQSHACASWHKFGHFRCYKWASGASFVLLDSGSSVMMTPDKQSREWTNGLGVALRHRRGPFSGCPCSWHCLAPWFVPSRFGERRKSGICGHLASQVTIWGRKHGIPINNPAWMAKGNWF